MTLSKGPDPIKPIITFDNYVIPETVKSVPKSSKRATSASPVGTFFSNKQRPVESSSQVPAGLLVIGTFVLGIVTTLYFATPEQTSVAQVTFVQDSTAEPVAPLPVAMIEPIVIEEAEQPADKVGIASLERAVVASLEQDVTRQDTTDLISPTGGRSSLDLTPVTLAEILSGLTPTRSSGKLSTAGNAADKSGETFMDRDILATLRESVLSGTYTVRTVKRNGVKRLCLRVPHANVSQDQAADLLREAAERGEIELPDAVNTADGNFDADTLIFNLVQTSLANDGTEAGAKAAQEMKRRAFIAANAKTKTVAGERIYVVQPGDSLAYLSLQFYGQPSDFTRIFQANRKILRSPDYIQVGQRLIIPG